MFQKLKEQVCHANRQLSNCLPPLLTWGNASGVDRDQGVFAIKPSGVDYKAVTPENIVVVTLSGEIIEGALRPSSDTPTHQALYNAWPEIGGITHTHTPHATMFAQAGMAIPCFGTTHADHFFGEVPVTRALSQKEVAEAYEINTGRVIVERFSNLSPAQMPAVLVANHGPFTWGRDAMDALRNSMALEVVAQMPLGTVNLNPAVPPVPKHLLRKHYSRKHGPHAYYGQTLAHE